MEQKAQLLVVDDDLEIRELLQQFLTSCGFTNVHTATDGKSARKVLDQYPIDLVILDIMLPGEDGFSIAKSIREESLIPILMLSARAESSDRIQGLEIGADDYLVKPFIPEELLARIHAILRRTLGNQLQEQNIKFGTITLLVQERCILRRGARKSQLTGAEFKLLSIFLNQPNQIIDRKTLSREMVGNLSLVSSRAIDVQISRLRNRIGDNDNSIIQTIRNEGYILTSEVSMAG